MRVFIRTKMMTRVVIMVITKAACLKMINPLDLYIITMLSVKASRGKV